MKIETCFMNVYHDKPDARYRIGNSRLYGTWDEAYEGRVRDGNYIDTVPLSIQVRGEYMPLDEHGRVDHEGDSM